MPQLFWMNAKNCIPTTRSRKCFAVGFYFGFAFAPPHRLSVLSMYLIYMFIISLVTKRRFHSEMDNIGLPLSFPSFVKHRRLVEGEAKVSMTDTNRCHKDSCKDYSKQYTKTMRDISL